MSPQQLYNTISAIQVALGIVTLILLIRTHELSTYWPMLVISTWEVVPYATLLAVRQAGPLHMSARYAYIVYFYVFWSVFAVQAICAIILTYVVFNSAMRPLKGLQQLGKIVYFWAALISVIITADVAFSPHVRSGMMLQALAAQFQRATGLITVSLIAFVCISIRPMGLSIRSRVFGTGVGLIVVSLTNALQANFFLQHRTIYGTYASVQIGASCLSNLIWIYYFAVPEPKRRFVLLPTTSPFHHWNRISELLGHEPGYVAIGGVPPESFAGAEIDIFRRASAKMKELEDQEKAAALPTGRS